MAVSRSLCSPVAFEMGGTYLAFCHYLFLFLLLFAIPFDHFWIILPCIPLNCSSPQNYAAGPLPFPLTWQFSLFVVEQTLPICIHGPQTPQEYKTVHVQYVPTGRRYLRTLRNTKIILFPNLPSYVSPSASALYLLPFYFVFFIFVYGINAYKWKKVTLDPF